LSGDEILKQLTQTCAKPVRDTLAGIGGEEFALLLPQTTLEDAERLVERLRAGALRRQTAGQEPARRASRAELGSRRRDCRALDVAILASAFAAIVIVLVEVVTIAAQVAPRVFIAFGTRAITGAVVARRRVATVALGAIFILPAVGVELEHDGVDAAQVVEHAHRHVREVAILGNCACRAENQRSRDRTDSPPLHELHSQGLAASYNAAHRQR
jgi:GGDEF domain-containing protein